MSFDSSNEFMIELDSTAGSISFSQNLQYIMDLTQRSSGSAKKDYVALQGGTGDSEENVQSGITNFKQRNPELTFLAYFSKRDKSNNSLQNAVNNGDFTRSELFRFNAPDIQDVDTGNDTVTVDGDQTDRIDADSFIVITESTGNDGLYNVDSVSYDSGADQTQLSLAENVSDSTVDGFVIDGVKTVKEQKVWLEEYVFDGRIGEEYELRGQEFEDDTSTGRNVVLKQAEIVRVSQNPFTGQGRIQTGEGFNVG